jgi:RNA polymerase sigma-70 factor (ECF subfamily)
MNCDELLAALNEYVDGSIAPGACAELQRHLEGCNPCQVVVDNIRQTITLYKHGEVVEIPAACRERLHAALRTRWNVTHDSPA